MAYKFQTGDAILSGSLTREGSTIITNDAGAEVGVFDNGGVLSASAGATAASFTCDGALTAATAALTSLTASSGLKAGEVQATGHVIAPALISTNIVSGSGLASFESLRLGGGTATVSNLGAAVFGGSVTAVGSFVIGSADLNEADLEKLDGITNGTAAASKALVADANIDISGLRNLTATGVISAAGITLGSAVLVEAELEMLDGITAGTAAASKALVADSNIDIAGLRNVTGTGAITAGTSFIIGSADLNETDLEKLDGITNGAGAANKALVLDASADVASGLRNLTAGGALNTATLSASGDAGSNRFYVGGPNFGAASFKIDDAGVMVTNAILGTSFSGSSFVSASHLSINNNNASISALGDASFAAVPVGSLLKMPDNTSTKFLVADGTSYQEVAMSGDATMDNTGAIKLANNSVSNAQLDNDAVTGAELADDAVDSEHYTDGSIDLVHMSANSVDSDQYVDGSIDLIHMSANSIDSDQYVDGSIDDAHLSDGVATGLAGAGLLATSGVLSVQGSAVALGTDAVILSEGYNYFTGSATAVCTLPSGSIGDVVIVKAGPTGAGNTITISRSGSLDTIDNSTTVVLESPYAAVSMVYVTHGDWRIV